MVHHGRSESTKATAIRRALICLVLGSVMTIASAWWCALYSRGRTRGLELSGGPFFEQYRPERWPALTRGWKHEGFGIAEHSGIGVVFGGDRPSPRRPDYSQDAFVIIREYHSGFPWHSMHSLWSGVTIKPELAMEFEEIERDRPVFPLLDRGMTPPAWIPDPHPARILPLTPVWPGALYSVLLYAALVWPLLWVVEFTWRHRHFRHDYRCKQGLCVHCAYPVGDFAVCPECGAGTGGDA